MPIIEIFVLIKVGGMLGIWTTLFIVILTAVLGTAMLRQQSMATIQSVQAKLNSGELPASQLLEGVALLIGGVLLLTPGFITDAFGFFCLFPLTRRWLITKAMANSRVRVFNSSTLRPDSGTPNSHTSRSTSRASAQSGNPDIIEGEFRRED